MTCEAHGQENQSVKREKVTAKIQPASWFQTIQCHTRSGQTDSETAGETRDGISRSPFL
jgi:hypothetical protein